MTIDMTGRSASGIAADLRERIERGELSPGTLLPSVRAVAADLGVNRNTVVAAYRQLAQAGLVEARGRGGTRVADRTAVAQEGYTPDTVLRDVGTGNPDPALIPDPTAALARSTRPVLYGEPVIDPGLEAWARGWMADQLPHDDLLITVTSGASDAIERLLAQALQRDDAVALEDPCFLSALHTVRTGGYRAVPVAVDAEGMTVEGLRAALEAGVRAVICTPRAHNPTGASLSAERAAALREVLAEHPYVLVIEDDHFSLLSRAPLHSVIGPSQRRWARIRSMSKFLGPDTCLAVTASDPDTADGLAVRLTPGTTWVSHILQRMTLALVTDDSVRADIEAAAEHYAARNAAFAAALTERGLPVAPGDGLNLWVPLPVPAASVREELMHRGWLVREGDPFFLSPDHAGAFLRLTVHDLDEASAAALADDLAVAAGALRPGVRGGRIEA
ncbi:MULTISPECIES: aminotransferase class I/II-fold pyridoxal phosphate-dependent enzyme [unclassified Microbacterium]|uniref:aminotransferase class I/II-fold pyridoxal phosphate-dependent enzyme n=1 Tax=unclassified Microbacterium TaxID=2609290 RepID=UPI00226E4544|nr:MULTISPECIES: aminotransferase class I/II-fold pyridoxal phosphate-dependent enzyme [unclassified Microbacterium]MDQ1177854.1 DNA-binding transcriptional MocR family regulator [Microbacterium sp. SORGH_AS_0421]WAC68924.1 aminotransferase class I/II-fold pyridoxal phosphate-dependent enzyme [Microbacterium sp. SL75]